MFPDKPVSEMTYQDLVGYFVKYNEKYPSRRYIYGWEKYLAFKYWLEGEGNKVTLKQLVVEIMPLMEDKYDDIARGCICREWLTKFPVTFSTVINTVLPLMKNTERYQDYPTEFIKAWAKNPLLPAQVNRLCDPVIQFYKTGTLFLNTTHIPSMDRFLDTWDTNDDRAELAYAWLTQPGNDLDYQTMLKIYKDFGPGLSDTHFVVEWVLKSHEDAYNRMTFAITHMKTESDVKYLMHVWCRSGIEKIGTEVWNEVEHFAKYKRHRIRILEGYRTGPRYIEENDFAQTQSPVFEEANTVVQPSALTEENVFRLHYMYESKKKKHSKMRTAIYIKNLELDPDLLPPVLELDNINKDTINREAKECYLNDDNAEKLVLKDFQVREREKTEVKYRALADESLLNTQDHSSENSLKNMSARLGEWIDKMKEVEGTGSASSTQVSKASSVQTSEAALVQAPKASSSTVRRVKFATTGEEFMSPKSSTPGTPSSSISSPTADTPPKTLHDRVPKKYKDLSLNTAGPSVRFK